MHCPVLRIIKFQSPENRRLQLFSVDSNGAFHPLGVLWSRLVFGIAQYQPIPLKSKTRWWFQIFFIFTPTWGNGPI